MILLYIHPITLEILSLRYCIVTFSRKVTGRNQAANPSVTCWIRSFRRSLRCPESHESMVQIHECLIVVGAQISSLSCICRECRFVCLKHLLFFFQIFPQTASFGKIMTKKQSETIFGGLAMAMWEKRSIVTCTTSQPEHPLESRHMAP